MKRIVSRLPFALLVCVLVVFASGCRDREERADFTFINRGDLFTLDLNKMSYLQDFRVTNAIREGLYTYDPVTYRPIPALAVDEQVSEDQKTWTFKLRTDAKWSNGDPVTAHDFVFSWRLMLESPGSYTSLFHYIEGAEQYEKLAREGASRDPESIGVRALDDHTLEVRLVNPVPFMRDLVAFAPFYPRHEASMRPFRREQAGRISYDESYTRPGNVVTNGPFKLTEWQVGKRVRLTRNPNYWDYENVRSNVIEMLVNDDPNGAFVMYDQGDVDWLADVNPEVAVAQKNAGRTDLRVVPAYGTAFITLNTMPRVQELGDQTNPLSDLRVRQALAMTIDRDYIVNRITQMGEVPAFSYVPPGFFEGWTSRQVVRPDLARARELLAEAGFAGGRGMPTLTITYNSVNRTRAQIAQLLKETWERDLGIRVNINPMEGRQVSEYISERRGTLSLTGWFGDYMDPSTFTDKYKSTSENNDSAWAVPEYDALLARAAAETNQKARFELLMQAEAMIADDLPIIPLYYFVNVTMQRDNVKGLIPNFKSLTVWKDVRVER